jgi:hypothetical protein
MLEFVKFYFDINKGMLMIPLGFFTNTSEKHQCVHSNAYASA